MRRQKASEAQSSRQQEKAAILGSHDWQHWNGIVRCRVCWCKFGQVAASRSCRPEESRLQTLSGRAVRVGHRLWLADFWAAGAVQANGVLVTCAACGAWSMGGRSPKLERPCGKPTNAGATARRRVHRGLFPASDARYRGATISDVLPLDLDVLK